MTAKSEQGGGIEAAYATLRLGIESGNTPAHRRSDGRAPMPLLPWTLLHRFHIRPDVPFTLHDHLYLIDIYNCTAKQVRIKKSGQSGVSEFLTSLGFHACDERRLDVLYVMPTHSDMQDFSQMRIESAIQASPYLSQLINDRPSKVHGRSARSPDNTRVKVIGNNNFVFRGGSVKDASKGPKAQRANRLKSVPADLIILDEFDEMDAQVLPLAQMRMGHSPVKEEWLVSTPSYPGSGIDKEWESSDQREWFVACPHCGKKQRLSIQAVVMEWDDFERPVAWHGMDEARAFVPCERCGKELNRLAPGEWVASSYGRDIAGFHISKLFSPHTPLLDVVQHLQTLDEAKRREAFNQDLGEVYEPRGGRPSVKVFNDCRRSFALGPLPPGTRTWMGVDVSPNGLHVIIRGPDPDEPGGKRLLLAAEIPTFYDVGRLMRIYNVGSCVVDALPETTMARGLQADYGDGVVWLAYFPWSDEGSKNPEPIVWEAKQGVVNMDRTRVMDAMYGRFYNQENTLPQNADQIPDYYDHLRAPVRITERNGKGVFVSRYSEGQNPDHFALAETYCYAASMRGTWWIS